MSERCGFISPSQDGIPIRCCFRRDGDKEFCKLHTITMDGVKTSPERISSQDKELSKEKREYILEWINEQSYLTRNVKPIVPISPLTLSCSDV